MNFKNMSWKWSKSGKISIWLELCATDMHLLAVYIVFPSKKTNRIWHSTYFPLRLESSFAKINMKQWDAQQTGGAQQAEAASKPAHAPKPPTQMTINVETPNGKTITLDVKPSDTIESVKDKVQEKEGIRTRRKHLLFNGVKLDDDSTLSDHNIQMNSTLRLGTGRH